MEERTCEWCGLGYRPKRRDQRTCSRDCRIKHNRAEQNAKRYIRHDPIPCPSCGISWTPPRSDSRACSPRCARKLTYVPRDHWHEKVCAHCSSTFSSKRSDARYCSHQCALSATYDSAAAVKRAKAWAEAHPEAIRAAKRANKIRRKYAELSSPGVSANDWLRLLNRYQHGCAYCGTRADVLHMDHVVPLARGGLHQIGNVLPACAPCNLSKNARLLAAWKRGR